MEKEQNKHKQWEMHKRVELRRANSNKNGMNTAGEKAYKMRTITKFSNSKLSSDCFNIFRKQGFVC